MHFKVLMDLPCVATHSQPTTTAKNNGKEGCTLSRLVFGCRLIHYKPERRLYSQALVDVEGKR